MEYAKNSSGISTVGGLGSELQHKEEDRPNILYFLISFQDSVPVRNDIEAVRSFGSPIFDRAIGLDSVFNGNPLECYNYQLLQKCMLAEQKIYNCTHNY